MEHARRMPHAAAAVLLGITLLAVTGIGVGVAVRGDGPHAGVGDPARGITYAALGWAAVAAVLLLGRRWPGPAVTVTGALGMVATVVVPGPPVVLLPVVASVIRAMLAGARVWAVATVATAYLVPVVLLFVTDSAVTAARGFATMTLLLIGLGAGVFLRSRATRAAEDARRRDEAQRIAVEQERVRIARDLHDVLAHSLSSITVQAGVGLHLAADRPAAAVEALETIRAVSGEALDEVRAVLGILRGDDSAPVAPGPDLDAVTALVADARRTGARVELADELSPRPPRPAQVALFRVVQEALTNARRHAPGSAVTIGLARDGADAVARVRDLPGRRPTAPVAGNGITGMRERVTSLGGSLELVAHDDGLEVVARVPAGAAP